MRIGLALPHFSRDCTWERVIGFAPEIERLGFDSVWARDHLSFEPGPVDPPGRRFIDPFVALAAISGATSTLVLGFAVIVPLRHPLITTQLAGSLEWVSRGRVELGLGIGGPPGQFKMAGVDYASRIKRCEETAEIIRLAAGGQEFSYHGPITQFDGAAIDPAPSAKTPIWYGGYSAPARRRAVRLCDGIMPSRTPFTAFDPAVAALREMAAAASKTMLVGSAPLVSLGTSRKDGLRRAGDRVAALARAADPGDGQEADLSGALIAGNSADCIEELQKFTDRGVDCVVLDFRLRMGEFEDAVRRVGDEVLPTVKAAMVSSDGIRAHDTQDQNSSHEL
jgi:alkanesulfonate monooxygenase SsuD/methylene tetrahydromethanopterin reductase-like flavin-dependent oxidoreductase (luciferase family)